MHTTYLRIALPVPLRRLFDYLPPPDWPDTAPLQPGIRISVPFGKQTMTGVLLEVSNTTTVPGNKLKAARQILDEHPLLPKTLLNLILWAADYYQHPRGDALLSVLPSSIREGKTALLQSELWWRLTTFGKGLPEGALKRSPRQAALLERLQQGDLSSTSNEGKLLDSGSTIFRALHKKKLIEPYRREIDPESPDISVSWLAETPHTLNTEQLHAVRTITDQKGFSPFLLQGITGSGKTEVYLQVIEGVLKKKRQALVLVPEIGLTPQTIERFRKRFNKPVVAFHSGLNKRERLDAWLRAARNEAAIVIGTRSAIFTPMPYLGVIIVDEEHDSSFKQQDNFRYHARDVAIMRAREEAIPIILGSATPSLESLRNAALKRYELLTLGSRAGNAKKPTVHLLNIAGHKLQEGFSPVLLDMINQELARGNQVLVFLNRRGYAPVLLCSDCGWIASCAHCDARLTVHKKDGKLRCHHCGWQGPIPEYCTDCHGKQLDTLGFGTQRSEAVLKKIFPEVRVIRIDRDSTSRKHSAQELFTEIRQGDPAILIGTQMLAKGHHFPDVTLVAVLDADGGIFSADFRSAEKLVQLLTQVAGRAGRADKPGQVIIQSCFCEHPLLQNLARQDYPTLAHQLLLEREQLGLPPYQTQAILRCEALRACDAENFLQQARELASGLLPSGSVIHIMGPLPALMEKRANRFRHELIFYSPHRPQLQRLLTTLALQLEDSPQGKKLRWAIDVDPV